MSRKALATALAAAAAAAGCGGQSDAHAAKTAMQNFLAAIHDGNGSRACSLLAPDAASQLGRGSAANCPQVLASATAQQRQQIGKLRVSSVKVSGKRASVTLDYSAAGNLPHGSGPSSMVKVGGAWKVENIP
jgi:hypothetical protein